MAQDEELSARFREALAGHEGISEKPMMGGRCFFLHGNMVGGADRSKEGVERLMFRVGKENVERASLLPGGEPMVLGGRPMHGFFFVRAEDCDDRALQQWLNLALGHAQGLPPK